MTKNKETEPVETLVQAICTKCGTLYPIEEDKCPMCGEDYDYEIEKATGSKADGNLPSSEPRDMSDYYGV